MAYRGSISISHHGPFLIVRVRDGQTFARLIVSLHYLLAKLARTFATHLRPSVIRPFDIFKALRYLLRSKIAPSAILAASAGSATGRKISSQAVGMAVPSGAWPALSDGSQPINVRLSKGTIAAFTSRNLLGILIHLLLKFVGHFT